MKFLYAILHHRTDSALERPSHWDLLIVPDGELEASGSEPTSLLAFATETAPEEWESGTQFLRLANHRPIYLNYEGPLTGNRGSVQRLSQGEVAWHSSSEDELVFSLRPSASNEWAPYSLRRIHALNVIDALRADEDRWILSLANLPQPSDCSL